MNSECDIIIIIAGDIQKSPQLQENLVSKAYMSLYTQSTKHCNI